jgi:hypothetical protein
VTSARLAIAVGAFATVLVMSACADGSPAGPATQPSGVTGSAPPRGGGADIDEACDLTEPKVVAEVFGGTVAAEEPGPVSSFSCGYLVEGGAAEIVSVIYYGGANKWDYVKTGVEKNRKGITPVPGVGDEAFNPNDYGALELTVVAGDVVFTVGATNVDGRAGHAAGGKVTELAKRIVDAIG